MKSRARDAKGRFKKASPPLPADVVKALGEGRKPYELTLSQEWNLVILDKRGWRDWLDGKRDQDTEAAERTKA